MRTMKYTYIKWILVGVFSIVAFVVIAQFAQTHHELLKTLITQAGIFGILSYIGLLVLAVVIAPISTAFLLPIAANSWGPFLAALYSISGWTIGSLIAFLLARRFGARWVRRFESIQKICSIEKTLTKRNVFWYVVLLRLAFPVDVLSYALGLFSSMTFSAFFWSTIIGITPFSFLFAYASVSNIWIQSAVGLLGVVVFVGGSYYVYIQSKTTTYKSTQRNVRVHNETDDTSITQV